MLVIDMLNAYRHPDADRLASNTADIIEPLTELIARARTDEDVDVVYVNDNSGTSRRISPKSCGPPATAPDPIL